MVNVAEPDSKAQVVLVGAVAIAFIILGIVVVLNTSLYAENVGSTGTVSAVDQAEQLEHVGGESVAGLAYRVNQDDYNQAGLETAMTENVSDFSAVWQALLAESGPTLANVSYNDSATDYGVQLVDGGGSFENSSGSRNWALADTSEPADVAEFEMEVDSGSLHQNRADAFHVAVRGTAPDGDAKWRVMWFSRDASGDLQIDTYTDTDTAASAPSGWEDWSSGTHETCTAPGSSSVDIDVSNGTVDGVPKSCLSFTDGIAPISGGEGYELWFRNADEVTGDYSMMTSLDDPGSAPSHTDIVWAAGVDVYYDTQSTSYRRTITVPVYNDSTR
ncbi:DUF7261 family protein [Haloarchaeobius sp. HRN-SO-5]|uniref:DUF7261 family protein n=1 Tax=Haloarchaeobius sp. HRN-SO-5 TaxID=3446118 RepID=UPI003EBE62F8